MEQHAEIGNVTVTYHNEEDFQTTEQETVGDYYRKEYQRLGYKLSDIWQRDIVELFHCALLEDTGLDPHEIARFMQEWLGEVLEDLDSNSMYTSKALDKYTDRVIHELLDRDSVGT